MDFDLLLDEASPRETVVPLCLNGKLRAEYEAVKARIEERAAHADDGDDLPEGDDRLATRKREPEPDPEQSLLDDLEEKMRAHTVPFKLRALGRQEWADLFSQHKPRREGQTGKLDPRDSMNVNSTTFFPALVRASVVEPEMSPERWAKLDKVLSDAQFDKLATAAWLLNRVEEDVPFSLSGSASTPT
ncbi:hypothetical protein GCM10011608_09950 [Micromonospora sonchi]|uniref:Tail assembly chaperone n=1 Tax=Micromonospora sonchi TaxID=1763543 RepID=A0A917TLQ4_9ACTN|nr:hypothetical protein [Micromonospora sonchi]GGM27175.1 hypothetical protein GCM10011608_09950 [Micromonospora sonchi]